MQFDTIKMDLMNTSITEAFKSRQDTIELKKIIDEELDKLQYDEIKDMSISDLLNTNRADIVLKLVQNEMHKIQAEKNEYYTPKKAFEAIKQYIPNKTIWEPFVLGNYEHIKSPQYLRELGFTVISTNEDFFKCSYGEIVVSNPPYTTRYDRASNRQDNIKSRVITRLCELNKPFMLLMPLTFIQTIQLEKLQAKYGRFKFIVPSRRITFYKVKDGERKEYNSPDIYNSAIWYCWKIKLKHSINFV